MLTCLTGISSETDAMTLNNNQNYDQTYSSKQRLEQQLYVVLVHLIVVSSGVKLTIKAQPNSIIEKYLFLFFNSSLTWKFYCSGCLNFSSPVCCSSMCLITNVLFATFPNIRVPILKALPTIWGLFFIKYTQVMA